LDDQAPAPRVASVRATYSATPGAVGQCQSWQWGGPLRRTTGCTLDGPPLCEEGRSCGVLRGSTNRGDGGGLLEPRAGRDWSGEGAGAGTRGLLAAQTHSGSTSQQQPAEDYGGRA
jgi:hypothetical protein